MSVRQVYDELYLDSVRVVLETGRGSVAMLQRRLNIGYARASRIIDMLAANCLLSQYTGHAVRQANMTYDEYCQITAAVFDLRDACQAAVDLCVNERGPVHRADVCRRLEDALDKANPVNEESEV